MYDERFQAEHCTATLSPLRFNVYLLLSIHVVFYPSLRLAPGCLASTLVSMHEMLTNQIILFNFETVATPWLQYVRPILVQF